MSASDFNSLTEVYSNENSNSETAIEISKTKFNDKVKFGKNVLLGDNVKIGADCTIGHNSIIEKFRKL